MEVSTGTEVNQSASISPTDYSSMGNEGTTSSQSVTLDQIIPEDYKGATYLESVKDIDSLFNQFHNLQKKLGERPSGVPQESASEEEWNKFYTTFGRPEQAAGYEFEKVEGLSYDDSQMEKVKGLFHEAGLNAKQAKMIQTGFDKMQLEQLGDSAKTQEQRDAEFESLTTSTFGERREEAIAGAKEMLQEFAPQEFGEHIGELDNKSLVALASVLDGVKQKYLSEDSIGRGVGSIPKQNPREQAIKLMQTDAYKNAFHPEHEQTRQKISQLYRGN